MDNILVKNISELDKAAKVIAEKLMDYRIVCFYGEMGVGKTTLIKVLCKMIGIKTFVTSPTFSIINEYTSTDNKTYYHIDLYRISDKSELYNIGIEDYIFDEKAILFIEWPEIVEDIVPQDETLFIKIIEKKNKVRVINFI